MTPSPTSATYDPRADWTAIPTFTALAEQPPALTRHTPISFGVIQPTLQRLGALAYWLIDNHQYQPIAARSTRELTRLRTRRGSLIIVYHSGSVLVQGADVDKTVALLETLVEVQL